VLRQQRATRLVALVAGAEVCGLLLAKLRAGRPVDVALAVPQEDRVLLRFAAQFLDGPLADSPRHVRHAVLAADAHRDAKEVFELLGIGLGDQLARALFGMHGDRVGYASVLDRGLDEGQDLLLEVTLGHA